jgi:hypothetical protein
MDTANDLMTQQQLWEALGIGRSTYYARIRPTITQFVHVSPGRVMLSRKTLEDIIANCTVTHGQYGNNEEEEYYEDDA